VFRFPHNVSHRKKTNKKKIQKIVFPQIHKPPKTERKDNPKTQTKTPKPIPKFTQFSKAVPKPIPKSA